MTLQRKGIYVISILLLCHILCNTELYGSQSDSVVVFNEIMYHPQVDEANLEWLELYNQTAVDIDLTGWSIR